MECKKCKSIIDENASFCPYCGERVKENDSYSDPFASYRQDFSHDAQYQYQQQYSNVENQTSSSPIQYMERPKKTYTPNSYSLIGLILSIAAVFFSFVHVGFSIIALVIALVLIIAGFRHTHTAMKVCSILFFVLSLIFTVAISVSLLVFNLEVHFANGYSTTIKDYLIDAFNAGYHSDSVYGIWVSDDGEVFDLRSTSQFTYYNEEGRKQYQGTYSMSDGYTLSDGDVIFADEEYYLYDFNDDKDSFLGTYHAILCIEKEDKDVMRILVPELDVYVEFERVSSHPFLESDFVPPSEDDSVSEGENTVYPPLESIPGIVG